MEFFAFQHIKGRFVSVGENNLVLERHKIESIVQGNDASLEQLESRQLLLDNHSLQWFLGTILRDQVLDHDNIAMHSHPNEDQAEYYNYGYNNCFFNEYKSFFFKNKINKKSGFYVSKIFWFLFWIKNQNQNQNQNLKKSKLNLCSPIRPFYFSWIQDALGKNRRSHESPIVDGR